MDDPRRANPTEVNPSGPEEGAAIADPPDALTRGFLFADLRGYTAFVESRGAVAAAQLLYTYRALVRDAVTRYRGAEIKTEGDSFYVVFSSVSRAVECGLAIVAAASETSRDPDQQVEVGVGVHAGETVQTPEGYVGSAVNMAARLCSAAKPGEVLVSETVRALTANTSDFRFVPAGRRRLKGIAEPVAVHRAMPSGAAVGGSRYRVARPRLIIGLGAAVLVGAVAVGVAMSGSLQGAMDQNSTPSPVESAPSLEEPPPSEPAVGTIPVGPLNPGTYVSRLLVPEASFTVGTGWSLVEEQRQVVHLTRTSGPGQDFYILPFEGAIDPADPGGYERVESVEGAHAFIEWIAGHEYVTAEPPILLDLPNGRGEMIDFVAEIPDAMGKLCGYPCIMFFLIYPEIHAFDRFAIADGFLYRLIAVDRLEVGQGPRTMVILLEVQQPESFDAFASEAQAVVNTITFSD